MRSILLRPDSPAVLVLGHFSTQRHEENGFVGPDHWHSVVSQFYDLPYIRCVALPPGPSIHSHASLKIAPKPLYIHLTLRHRPLSLHISPTLSWLVPRATVFSQICLSHISNLKFASRGAQRKAPVPFYPYSTRWERKMAIRTKTQRACLVAKVYVKVTTIPTHHGSGQRTGIPACKYPCPESMIDPRT